MEAAGLVVESNLKEKTNGVEGPHTPETRTSTPNPSTQKNTEKGRGVGDVASLDVITAASSIMTSSLSSSQTLSLNGGEAAIGSSLSSNASLSSNGCVDRPPNPTVAIVHDAAAASAPSATPAVCTTTSNNSKRRQRERSGKAPELDKPSWLEIVEDGCKRARRPPPRFSETMIDSKEAQVLRQAIENSKIETHICDSVEIPEVKTYRPTVEEFKDPIRFIESIKAEGEFYGIVKIIPPDEWDPPTALDMESPMLFKTRKQSLRYFKEGTGFDEGRSYNFDSYEKMAKQFYDDWIDSRYRAQGIKEGPFNADLERDYWRIIETQKDDVVVEYANDLDTLMYGSGFPKAKDQQDQEGAFIIDQIGREDRGRDVVREGPEYYERCGWNLNNLPVWPGSVLRYIRAPLNGVNVPWLYMGMLFSTFCWHNEDNFMYSVNFLHHGSSKQWYSVPGYKAEAMEKVMKGFLRETFQQIPDMLHHMTTQFSPMLFQRAGVPVFKALQESGEFIVTFPKSFHAGFSYGFNCAEAVNFSPPVWLSYGREAVERYRGFARPSVFSHDRLVLTLANNLSNDWSPSSLKALLNDLTRIVKEEEFKRAELKEAGLRFGVVERSKLLPNNLTQMDNKSLDYDEKRVCFRCRHICFMSAVACECNSYNVSCLREAVTLCQCPMNKRFLLAWHDMEELWEMVRKVEDFIRLRAASPFMLEEGKKKGCVRALAAPAGIIGRGLCSGEVSGMKIEGGGQDAFL